MYATCPCDECDRELRDSAALDAALALAVTRFVELQALKAAREAQSGIVIRFPVERTTTRGAL